MTVSVFYKVIPSWFLRSEGLCTIILLEFSLGLFYLIQTHTETRLVVILRWSPCQWIQLLLLLNLFAIHLTARWLWALTTLKTTNNVWGEGFEVRSSFHLLTSPSVILSHWGPQPTGRARSSGFYGRSGEWKPILPQGASCSKGP